MAMDYPSYLQYVAERNIAMTLRLDALSAEQRANLDALLQLALDPNSTNQSFTFPIDSLGGDDLDTLPPFLTWFLEQNGSVLYDPLFDVRHASTVTIAFQPK